MSQVTNPERDAIDPQVLAQAVRTYMLAADRDEADIDLEAVLMYQGVLAPTEAIGHIDIGDEWVTVNLESGEIFNVYADGTTEVF